MKARIERLLAIGFCAAALGALFACSTPSDETVIQDMQARLEELTTQVNDLSQKVLEVVDATDNLQAQVDKSKQFIAQGGGAKAQDYSAEINVLRAEIETLKNDLRQSLDPTRRAPSAKPTPGAAGAAPSASKPAAERPASEGGAAAARAPKAPEPEAPTRLTGRYYRAKAEDTFESIAAANGISAQSLREANNAGASQQPLVNSNIWIPVPPR